MQLSRNQIIGALILLAIILLIAIVRLIVYSLCQSGIGILLFFPLAQPFTVGN